MDKPAKTRQKRHAGGQNAITIYISLSPFGCRLIIEQFIYHPPDLILQFMTSVPDFTRLFLLQQMKVLFFLLLVLILPLLAKDRQAPFLLIFTSQGTYYKLQAASKHVEWYNTLGTSLLSFQLTATSSPNSETSYILPTLDGHFLYIDAHSEILIDRKEVEQLLNVCFETQMHHTTINERSRYFIYEKYEYYIINLNNGKAQDLQDFLKNGIPKKFDRMAVLKVSKKFLKQLKEDLSVAWSTISSEIDLVPAETFIMNPKASSANNKIHLADSQLKFRRIGNNEIELIRKNETFEMGGSSHIIGIFEYLGNEKGYLHHPMEYHYRPKLALQHISHKESNELKEFSSVRHSQKINFIHSEQANRLKKNKNTPKELEFCINTFRNLKALTDQSKNFMQKPSGVPLFFSKIDRLLSNNTLAYPQPQPTSAPQIIIQYGPTQDQPYIWLALFLTILLFVYWFHKMKINSLLNKFSAMENQTDQRFQEFKKKLDKFQELQKMYEVYWDKVIYNACGYQWYEHIVYQGKFLNQATYVYAVRQEGTDIVSLEHKLNTLLNFSHKGLAKLYYYTKNSDYLLIFTEKTTLLSMQVLPDFLGFEIANAAKKAIITDIVQAVAYLDSKIEISWLPQEAICLGIKKQPETDTEITFKLNSIPCMLKRSVDDSQPQEDKSGSADNSTFELRTNMVSLFHLIIHKGERFNKQRIDELLKNQAYSQDQYLEFFDFILYQSKSKSENPADKDLQGQPVENLRALMFKDILDHPFLWDSKRKILFLSDFSNYIETHIDDQKVKKLQSHAKDYNVIKTPWIKEFHFLFVKEISNYRKYDFQSVRDLIRVIRNKLNHFHEIPKEVKSHIGKTPEGFIEYCLELFPKLLHFAYVYTRKKKWRLHMK